MFCVNCGTRLEPDAKFCINCGTAVAATSEDSTKLPQSEVVESPSVEAVDSVSLPIQQQSQQPQQPLPPQNNTQKEVKIWKSVVALSAIALLLVGGFVISVWFLFNSENGEYVPEVVDPAIYDPEIIYPAICDPEFYAAKHFDELLGKWKFVPGFGFFPVFNAIGTIEFLPDGTIIDFASDYRYSVVGKVSIPEEGKLLYTDRYGITHEFTYTLIGNTLTIMNEDNEQISYVRYMVDGPSIPIDFSHLVGEWRHIDGFDFQFYEFYEYVEFFDDGTIVAFNRSNNWSSTGKITMLDKGIFRITHDTLRFGLINSYTLDGDTLTIYALGGVIKYERVESASPAVLDYSHLVGIWQQTPEIFFVFFDNTDYIELVYIRGNVIEFGTLTMIDEGVFLTEYEFTPGSLCTYVLDGDELIVTNERGLNFYLTRINNIPIDFSQFYNPDEFNLEDFIADERLVGEWRFVGGVPIAPRTSLFGSGFEYFEDGTVVSSLDNQFSWIWLMCPDGRLSVEMNEQGEVYYHVIYNIREDTGSLILISEYGIFGLRRVD